MVFVGLSIIAAFAALVLGFITGVASTTRSHVNEKLTALGITRKTRTNLDEAVKIFRWIRSEDLVMSDALSAAYLNSEINERIDKFLENIEKEYK